MIKWFYIEWIVCVVNVFDVDLVVVMGDVVDGFVKCLCEYMVLFG